MNTTVEIVSGLPIEQLWAGSRLISTIKVRELERSDVIELLQSGSVRFVIGEIHKPLTWIPNNESFDVWRDELEPRLIAPGSEQSPESLPDSYGYLASEWKAYDGDTI